MKTQIKEGLIAVLVGLSIGSLVLLLSSLGWIELPLRTEKRFLFLLGICLFSFLFQMLISNGAGKEKFDDPA